MAYFLCEAHFWTVKHQMSISDNNIGCFMYHEKNDQGAATHMYHNEKMQYTEGRNMTWRVSNKRPEKLRESLKETEEILSSKKCLSIKWLSRSMLQIVVSSGVVITCAVSPHTGDVDRIFVDKSLIGKLSADTTSDVLLANDYMIVTYHDRSKIDYIHFSKTPSGDRRIEKLSSYEPKVSVVEIPGPIGRRLDRRISCSYNQDMVLCWWLMGNDEAWPWTPGTGDKEKTNIILLSVGASGSTLELVSYTRTSGELLSVEFSRIKPSQICTIEQAATSLRDVIIYVCIYECIKNRFQRLLAAKIPFKAGVVCSDRSAMEDKVVLGCTDGSLILYDAHHKLTQSTRSDIVASVVRWHPSGTIIIAINNRGDVQLFDLALSPLLIQLVSESVSPAKTISLTTYFKVPPSPVTRCFWSPLSDTSEEKLSECSDLVVVLFEKGPIVVMPVYLGVVNQGCLSALQLVYQYIKTRQIPEALNMLCALNWNTDGKTCFAALSAIVNQLLKLPLDTQTEGQLQDALGCFYVPCRPLSELTVLEYREPISRLARRFFHHLLRYSRFEKAFCLAVDIGARDLFMDIHYVAKDRGETALSEVAKRKAEQVETDSLSTESLNDGSGSERSLDSLDRDHASSYGSGQEEEETTEELQHCLEPDSDLRGDPRFQRHTQTHFPVDRSINPHDMSERTRQELEEELDSELIDAFTESFIERPQSGAKFDNHDTSVGSVHVIHFGVV